MSGHNPNGQLELFSNFMSGIKTIYRIIFRLKASLISVLLRSLTLGSKFLLVLFIARYLPDKELGIFGIMSSSIAISIQILGMDFYVFNTREILAHSRFDERLKLIRDQVIFHGLTYVLVLPLLLLFFIGGFLPWEYLVWFYSLVILEHISQETYRLFITLSRPVIANIILFFRSGAWTYGVITLYLIEPATRNISFIWLGWMIGLILCLAISFYILRTSLWNQVWRNNVDWSWIKKGFRTSWPFFGSTLALKAVEYADRYFIQYYHGESYVGIYTFYVNIANVINVFIFTGLTTVLYPKVVEAYQKGEIDLYKSLMRKMTIGTIVAALFLVTLAALLIKPVLLLTGKEIYFQSISAFWILLLSAVITVIAQIPHYALYVRKQDKQIILSTILALFIALLLNQLFVPYIGIVGASISSLSAMLTLGVLKFLFLLKFERAG